MWGLWRGLNVRIRKFLNSLFRIIKGLGIGKRYNSSWDFKGCFWYLIVESDWVVKSGGEEVY